MAEYRYLSSIVEEICHPLEPVETEVTSSGAPLEIDAVIFDIYGTLLVSAAGEPAVGGAENRAKALTSALGSAGLAGDLVTAGELGIVMLNEAIAEAHRQGKESGRDYPEVDILSLWPAVLEDLHSRGLLETIPANRSTQILAMTFECMVNPTWPMPGMIELLRNLIERSKSIGIVSNAQFYTPVVVESLTGHSVNELGFDPALIAYSWQHHVAKPSVSLFDPIISELGRRNIPPDRTLYVGNDMLNDIYTAGKCGCKTALFAGDRRSLRLRCDKEQCRNVVPDITITSLAELSDMII